MKELILSLIMTLGIVSSLSGGEQKQTINGIAGWKIGDILNLKDVVKTEKIGYTDYYVKSKSGIAKNLQFKVRSTSVRKIIYEINVDTVNYMLDESGIQEILGNVNAYKEHYNNLKIIKERFAGSKGDIPIEGEYRYEFCGRITDMRFSLSNIREVNGRLTAVGSYHASFRDPLLNSRLDEAHKLFKEKKLVIAKEKMEKLFEDFPTKKNDTLFSSFYNDLVKKIEIEKKMLAAKREKEQKEFEEKIRSENAALDADPLNKKYDRMQKITWYQTKRDCWYHDDARRFFKIELYAGKYDSGAKILRLKTRYEGENWIFFDRVQIMGDNNVEFNIYLKYPDKQTDNDKNGVSEWADISVTKDLKCLFELSKASVIYVKFYGKYSHEFTMHTHQYKCFNEVIDKFTNL